jgi:EAL domain-containing protein (putative c-di-GMP-specific phosphodiesterase class I)/GGDEF domain-containing protein
LQTTSMIDMTPRDIVDQFRMLIRDGGIRPVFQPIVDIRGGSVFGYEVLSRGKPPLESPEAFFRVARENDMLWECEQACRKAAFSSGPFKAWNKDARLFINVSPEIFVDPRFRRTFSAARLKEAGFSERQMVFEITEKCSVPDYRALSEAVAHFRHQGFEIALDDLGAGNSGLQTLACCAPDYMKIDMSLIRGITHDPYKQNIVAFLCSFSSKVNAKVIAEGVEDWDDLRTVLELGVRFAQGYCLARPTGEIEAPEESVMREIRDIRNDILRRTGDVCEGEEGVMALAQRGTVLRCAEIDCEEMERRFRRSPSTDHVVVLDGAKPYGLITRQGFFQKMGGAFGYQLFQKQAVECAAKRDFLAVPRQTPVSGLAKSAMERCHDDLYDPVVVVDENGNYSGTITMKQIISRAEELEIERALNCNPLSGLPGNRHIEAWIRESRDGGTPFSLIYADLDRFKEYNDTYGFTNGDRLIMLLTRILRDALADLPKGSRLGHVGGDDFVCVVPGKVPADVLKTVCVSFDRDRMELFSRTDALRGFFEARDRKGEICQVRLTTLSLSVVESEKLEAGMHAGHIAQVAASLKHYTKQMTALEGKSTYLFERRVHSTPILLGTGAVSTPR